MTAVVTVVIVEAVFRLKNLSVSTMTYCVVQINCLPLPRFLKEVTMKTAEERYEETWNSYLELLNKDPRAWGFLCQIYNKY